MIEFKRRELAFKIYGKEYIVLFPTVKQSQDYAKKAKEGTEEAAGEMLIDFLDMLGLPKNVALEMEAEHLAQLVEHLVPPKKK